MPNTTGTVDLESTSTVTWPVASGYTNGFDMEDPSKNAIEELGVHFYRLAQANYTDYHRFDTDIIDRLENTNVTIVLDLLHVWALWQKRNNKTWKYYVWEHLDDFEDAIDQAVNRIQSHVNNSKLWVNVWNEPDWWLEPSVQTVDWDNPDQVETLKKMFWKGNYQDFQNTWETAYNKLRENLSPENKILGPGLSPFYGPPNDPTKPHHFKNDINMDGQ